MKCAVVTTTSPDVMAALEGLCEKLSADLGGEPPDLLVTFFTAHHSGDAPALRERLLARLSPRVLLGCPAAGVIGGEVEIEDRTGLTVWAARFPGARLLPFALELDEQEGEPMLTGWPELPDPDTSFLVLADPYTTPGELLLSGFTRKYPGATVIGGMASGTLGPGQALLLGSDGIHDEGVVGVALSGAVSIDPVVSQGCRPVGRHFVVTRANQNVIVQLGGKPALAQLRGVFNEADERDRNLIRNALHVGRVVDERKSRYERGDLLVRNVLQADPQNETLAISDFVRAGQTIQFMVRDAEAASEDLRMALGESAALGPALGSLLFSCGGRGSQLFGRPHHDIQGVHRALGEIPTAGFFCNGEIGPVGGVPFLHGFTASVAVFRRRRGAGAD